MLGAFRGNLIGVETGEENYSEKSDIHQYISACRYVLSAIN